MTDPDRSPHLDGFTLIEVLITVVIVGIGVAGLMAGILTAASGAGASQKYADQRQQLAAAAERIQAAAYQPASSSGCDTLPMNAYTAAIGSVTAPTNSSGTANTAPKPTIKGIWYWNGATFIDGAHTYADPTDPSVPPAQVPGCFYDYHPGTSHMQRITLMNPGDTEELTFVKRQP